MKISVISDTHRDFEMLKAALNLSMEAGCELVVHLGDGQFEFEDVSSEYAGVQMIYVRGNCDYSEAPTTRIINASGYKIFCCHGHTLKVHDGIDELIETAKMNECKIALYGHTHVGKIEEQNGIFLLNPGSASIPRGKSKPSFGIIEIFNDGKIDMSLVELERKVGKGEPEVIAFD